MTHHSDQKYQQMLQTVNKETYLQQPLYGIDFIKPLTSKTKYYHAIIEQKLIKYLNSVHSSMANAITENEKKFQVHRALNQELKSKLIGVKSLILKKDYFFDQVDPKSSNTSKDSTFRDEAYIIQLVKYKLIWLYLEIQDTYLSYLKDDPITEEEIHYLYFSEEVPTKSFIIDAPDMHLPKRSNSIIKQPLPKKLKVIKDDIREPVKGILKYSEIIAVPDKFANLEIQLFDEGLLNLKYDFIKNRGNVQKMSAVYQVLIKKNYFNKLYHPGKKSITDLHIREFLNYRYTATINKQFRIFGNKEKGPALLDAYIEKNSWIELIPTGRNA
jgi:hypothetical protein